MTESCLIIFLLPTNRIEKRLLKKKTIFLDMFISNKQYVVVNRIKYKITNAIMGNKVNITISH